MSQNIALLGLGSAIADVLAFLGPADQHKLRCTSSSTCAWFDSAAENGSLAFFVTFASDTAAGSFRWKHAIANPSGAGLRREGSCADSCPMPPQATVTVHARNYYLSTFNVQTNFEIDDAIIECATIQLVADFPFEHKLVVTGLFGIRSIGDRFCSGVKAKEIEFRADSQLRSVGDCWMYFCPNLRSVTFTGFTALEEVGDDWLHNCTNLESIIYIGNMPNLMKVGSCWMSYCEKLKQVDLHIFTALKKVGHYWMSGCLRLEFVDLTRFIALEEVGDYWMYKCSSLKSITFADLPNLKKVGSRWMSYCENLTHVDLPRFPALKEVGDFWMFECSGLESIIFAGDMPRLNKIGYQWMSCCSNLKHVDLTGFTALEVVADNWLYNCSSLQSITFAGEMVRVGPRWAPKSERALTDYLLHRN